MFKFFNKKFFEQIAKDAAKGAVKKVQKSVRKYAKEKLGIKRVTKSNRNEVEKLEKKYYEKLDKESKRKEKEILPKVETEVFEGYDVPAELKNQQIIGWNIINIWQPYLDFLAANNILLDVSSLLSEMRDIQKKARKQGSANQLIVNVWVNPQTGVMELNY